MAQIGFSHDPTTTQHGCLQAAHQPNRVCKGKFWASMPGVSAAGGLVVVATGRRNREADLRVVHIHDIDIRVASGKKDATGREPAFDGDSRPVDRGKWGHPCGSSPVPDPLCWNLLTWLGMAPSFHTHAALLADHQVLELRSILRLPQQPAS